MSTFADDLRPGQRFDLGRYTITEDEIVEYAQRWDPVFIHVDPSAAQSTPLGGVVASGLHTLAIYQRLAVQALWSQFTGGIGRSFEIRFRRPVRPDTTLTGHLIVKMVTRRPERGDAAVVMDAALVDDAGDVVMELTNHSVLPLHADTTPSEQSSD